MVCGMMGGRKNMNETAERKMINNMTDEEIKKMEAQRKKRMEKTKKN